MSRWSDLEPDSRLLAALDHADSSGRRAEAIGSGDREQKKTWSNRFADASARMIASELALHEVFAGSNVKPNEDGPAEPLTSFAGGRTKRVDVVVTSPVVGLQLGVSLKGMNFRDSAGLQFDKNLTGRTYELLDEVRVIRETLPMAFMVGLYFLPIGSTEDKTAGSTSSFAHTVEHLRPHVGRTDAHSPFQADRMDMAFVALYVPGDREAISRKTREFHYSDELPRGVIRYFDVTTNPPKRGRPKLELTSDLEGFANRVARSYDEFVNGPSVDWSEPED